MITRYPTSRMLVTTRPSTLPEVRAVKLTPKKATYLTSHVSVESSESLEKMSGRALDNDQSSVQKMDLQLHAHQVTRVNAIEKNIWLIAPILTMLLGLGFESTRRMGSETS